AVVLLQWHTIRNLEHERDLLRAQIAGQPENLPATSNSEATIPTSDKGQERQELLRLRGEVTRLNTAVATRAVPNGAGPLWAQPEAIRRLINEGTESALRQVADLCTEAFYSTNVMGDKFAAFRQAFDDLAARAGNGDENALGILLQSMNLGSL